MRQAYVFSLDALIGAATLFLGILLVSNIYFSEPAPHPFYSTQDIVGIFSTLTIGEVNNPYAKLLVDSGIVANQNNTLLEQIAELWVLGYTAEAKALAANLSSQLLGSAYGMGLYVDNTEVYRKDIGNYTTLSTTKAIISGIESGKPVYGFTSRIYLSSVKGKIDSAFLFYGGFVGEGNLTKLLYLPANLDKVTEAYLEVNAGSDFSLFVNSQYSGAYAKGSSGGGYLLADSWKLAGSNTSLFTPGLNTIVMTFNSSPAYIAGGYLKVTYNTTSVSVPGNEPTYRFPGIHGIVNLYDAAIIPGNLTHMDIYLHYYSSNITVSLMIGNTTVYTSNASGNLSVTLLNSSLGALLSYPGLSRTTVPIRFGALGNASAGISSGAAGRADIVLVNDASGSMEWCSASGCTTSLLPPARYCGTQANYRPEKGAFCNWSTEDYTVVNNGPVCSGRWHANCTASELRKVDIALNASAGFNTVVLGTPGNRVSHVEYTSAFNQVIPQGGTWNDRYAPFPDSTVGYTNLSSDLNDQNQKLLAYLDSYWGTCICCGIEKATTILMNQSNISRYKAMVVMSDGEANDKCTGIGSGNAKTDAIQAAQNACSNNITVFAVGFGTDVDEPTLQAMVCNNGSYYNASNVSLLSQAYTQIANQLLTITYQQQLINVSSGGVNVSFILYEDSYLQANYTAALPAAFGTLAFTLDSPRFGNNLSQGVFEVPVNTTLLDAKATSYSEEKWTHNVTVLSPQRTQVFQLGSFSTTYQILGDPFLVFIPPEIIQTGNNTVHVSTGISPDNGTGGSPHNRIIYTLLVPGSGSYGGISGNLSGCIWHLVSEDGTNTTLTVPSSYNGTDECYFQNSSFPQTSANQGAFELFQQYDFDGDGLLSVAIDQGSVTAESVTVSNVPTLWGPSIVEVRVWR